jgi:D-3-phosphoglycerate dehydrogenase / 2-oxoglutarate reductase
VTIDHPERHVIVVGHGYSDYATEEAILRPHGVGRIVQVDPADDAFADQLARAEAILVRETPITAGHLAAAPKLRVIVRYGIGVDSVDLEAAKARRVYVANVPDYGAEDVSDHALALYLAVQRRIVTRDRALRAGAWNVGQAEPMQRTGALCFGFVGFGRIARALHRKIVALGVRDVLIADPLLEGTPPGTPGGAPEGTVVVDLATLAERADVISLHAPLTERTRHLVDAELLARLKPGAILINTARGGLVDERALLDALKAGRVRAGLDVFETEPPPSDHPFFERDDVVLSDHTGWYSEASIVELQSGAAREVARVFEGKPPASWVNRWEA